MTAPRSAENVWPTVVRMTPCASGPDCRICRAQTLAVIQRLERERGIRVVLRPPHFGSPDGGAS
jgi:hypothetical protein